MDLSALATPVYVEPPRYNKRRLTPAAYDILSDFFYDVSSHPTGAQCQALTDTIRQLPECEWYTVERVRSYFYQKRYQQGVRVKREPTASPPLLPASLPADLSTLASPKMTTTVSVSDADHGAVELLRSPARRNSFKARRRKAPTALLTSRRRPATLVSPASSEKTWAPTIVDFSATAASPIAHPSLLHYPFHMLYGTSYAPLAFPPAELRQPYYPWHYPSITAPPGVPVASTCTGAHPASIPPASAVVHIDLRLHDLAAELAHALTGPGPEIPPCDLPKTASDLMHRIGDQQTSEEFLRAVRGGAYARLGLLPLDALRTATPLALTH